ncbi:MAG: ATP synthase F0 subunit B [Acidobacteria bacterium]|nr:ATP synthase F0 subunit B [Acidobacteriota bacterium]
MKRLLIALIFALASIAQEHGAAEHKQAEHGQAAEGGHASEGPSMTLKWANFAILAAGLAYLIAKNAPAFFASRTAEIKKGLEEGAAMQREANERTAAMEARLKNLETEIAELRAKAKQEIAAEGERVKKETDAALTKIQANAETEIASAGKAERAKLKAYAAGIAIDIAEERLRGELNPSTDAGLIRSFLKGLN